MSPTISVINKSSTCYFWQQINVGMDEIAEMDQTYQKFYTQMARELIVFLSCVSSIIK